jgi:transcription elongation factor GreB
MSRAFVRESDEPQLPELPPLISPLPPGARNYLTPRGAGRLQAELTRLAESERPRLVPRAAEDIDAKHELQVLDQRIRYLKQGMANAEVVPAPPGPADTVRFGATVTVREEEGTESTYRIVGVDEADFEQHNVSWLSPLARALTNARLGDRVTLKTPRGERQLEVLRIAYEE